MFRVLVWTNIFKPDVKMSGSQTDQTGFQGFVSHTFSPGAGLLWLSVLLWFSSSAPPLVLLFCSSSSSPPLLLLCSSSNSTLVQCSADTSPAPQMEPFLSLHLPLSPVSPSLPPLFQIPPSFLSLYDPPLHLSPATKQEVKGQASSFVKLIAQVCLEAGDPS